MLTQHEYEHFSSSSKSCYSSDTNATVSVVQRYLTNVVPMARVQTTPPEVNVQSSTKEFMQQHFNEVSRLEIEENNKTFVHFSKGISYVQ